MNHLYPIFLKLSQLRVLIVGGGNVATEKLHFLFKSSPDAQVKVVAKEFHQGVKEIATQFPLHLLRDAFHPNQLKGIDLVIAATNDHQVNLEVRRAARERHVLVNVADTPALCDFYLGGIVTKGNVKVAISTNGKSPTLAKRIRQFLEELLPEEIDELANNLNQYRRDLKGDFEYKVREMNAITKQLASPAHRKPSK